MGKLTLYLTQYARELINLLAMGIEACYLKPPMDNSVNGGLKLIGSWYVLIISTGTALINHLNLFISAAC